MALILQYAYLQVLDLLTTVAFLLHGVSEGNPLVAFAMKIGPSPLIGLIVMKTAALGLGIWAWKAGRTRALARMNVAFAVVVVWNVFTIIAATAQRA